MKYVYTYRLGTNIPYCLTVTNTYMILLSLSFTLIPALYWTQFLMKGQENYANITIKPCFIHTQRKQTKKWGWERQRQNLLQNIALKIMPNNFKIMKFFLNDYITYQLCFPPTSPVLQLQTAIDAKSRQRQQNGPEPFLRSSQNHVTVYTLKKISD